MKRKGNDSGQIWESCSLSGAEPAFWTSGVLRRFWFFKSLRFVARLNVLQFEQERQAPVPYWWSPAASPQVHLSSALAFFATKSRQLQSSQTSPS